MVVVAGMDVVDELPISRSSLLVGVAPYCRRWVRSTGRCGSDSSVSQSSPACPPEWSGSSTEEMCEARVGVGCEARSSAVGASVTCSSGRQ